MRIKALLVSIAAVGNSSKAQEQYPDYQDSADGYEQDNLYQDYAMKQQGRAGGGG